MRPGAVSKPALLVDGFVKLVIASQDRMQPLNRADVDLRGRLVCHVKPRRREMAGIVKLSELAPVVGGDEPLELPECLTTEIRTVYQEKRIRWAPACSQQAITDVGSSERLARTRGHLDQRPRTVLSKRLLKILDGFRLGRPQVRGACARIEFGQQRDAGRADPRQGR